ncbi:MAG: magnesium protoporphyrin IX methyltransferase [Woeseiaceae bacterium]|nr:magnesium protoporphyrin IX methyltransferase [Woeseiaceae bacterium]
MRTSTYLRRRDQLTTYFDKTASAAWAALTSNEPVNRIRATVRAGRDDMRATLMSWLPEDLSGKTLLDAGCGTGALAVDAAKRGAHVIAIDVAANLVEVARKRAASEHLKGSIDFRVGDMLADAPATVDYTVAMDSLIHYDESDVRRVVADLADRSGEAVLFTAAPWTPALGLMHFVGRLIPHKSNRAPAIEPIHIPKLKTALDEELGSAGWATGQAARVKSGFYISQAVALNRL